MPSFDPTVVRMSPGRSSRKRMSPRNTSTSKRRMSPRRRMSPKRMSPKRMSPKRTTFNADKKLEMGSKLNCSVVGRRRSPRRSPRRGLGGMRGMRGMRKYYGSHNKKMDIKRRLNMLLKKD